MKSTISQFIWPTYLYEFENPYLFAVHLISHKSPLELENLNSYHGTQGLFSCELLECLLYNIRLSHILIIDFLKKSTAICFCQVYVYIKWQGYVIRDVGRSEILEGEGSSYIVAPKIGGGGSKIWDRTPLMPPRFRHPGSSSYCFSSRWQQNSSKFRLEKQTAMAVEFFKNYFRI